ncbi:YlxR family protein [Paraoerskovia marina]|uniref:YlxR family protein n=1 Tax=Paraoerskovia marina TaxID=545619 RepID=UPI0009F3D855|nr:YlxR family protein [Paraoerskovia marina]
MEENGQSSRAPSTAPLSLGPVRTCVGCRERTSCSALLRVVARTGSSGTAELVPDVRRSLPGRGAWIHADLACLDRAEKRRSFARALRVTTPVDVSGLRAHLEQNL